MIRLKSYLSLNQYHGHTKFDSDSFPLVMETGASCAISMDIYDFIELDKHEDTISGLGALWVEGMGHFDGPYKWWKQTSWFNHQRCTIRTQLTNKTC